MPGSTLSSIGGPNAPTRTPLSLSLSLFLSLSLDGAPLHTPFRFDAAEPSSCPRGVVGEGKATRLRTGDRTILLTRVRCAHLGVTHSFVRSFVRSFRRSDAMRCGSNGERYRRKKSGAVRSCDRERNRECTAPANCRQGDGDTGKIELK